VLDGQGSGQTGLPKPLGSVDWAHALCCVILCVIDLIPSSASSANEGHLGTREGQRRARHVPMLTHAGSPAAAAPMRIFKQHVWFNAAALIAHPAGFDTTDHAAGSEAARVAWLSMAHAAGFDMASEVAKAAWFSSMAHAAWFSSMALAAWVSSMAHAAWFSSMALAAWFSSMEHAAGFDMACTARISGAPHSPGFCSPALERTDIQHTLKCMSSGR